jgi:hypothetical protein
VGTVNTDFQSFALKNPVYAQGKQQAFGLLGIERYFRALAVFPHDTLRE